MSENQPERWTIARDRFPSKPNGDRLVLPKRVQEREWYATHPDAWALVEVVPAAAYQEAIERARKAENARSRLADLTDGLPYYRMYATVYRRPLRVWVLGRWVIGKRHVMADSAAVSPKEDNDGGQ